MFQRIIDSIGEKKNYVFVGEAGSGKSEVALNFAVQLKHCGDREVHFFDMDMTKPLFRSRDVCAEMEKQGIYFHYEEQFADAPTMVGGVVHFLKDPRCFVVMDIGGDEIGARAVGGFSGWINREETAVLYVLNAFRPWSDHIDHIDRTLGEILGVSQIQLSQVYMISNPNIGKDTTEKEYLEGNEKISRIISPYRKICFSCINEKIKRKDQSEKEPVFPLRLFLGYAWDQEETGG